MCSFTANIWCGDVVLKDLFPDLFAIALDRDAIAAAYVDGLS